MSEDIVKKPFFLSRGKAIGLSLIAAGLVVIIGGGYLLARIGQESILRAHADATATQWVSYIEQVIPDLSGIASGQTLSARDQMFFAHGIDTSSVKSYRIYDRHGELRAAGGHVTNAAEQPMRSETGVATVIKSRMSHLDMDIANSSHDDSRHAHSDSRHKAPVVDRETMTASERQPVPTMNHADHAAMHHGHDMGDRGTSETYAGPVVPLASGDVVTAYFHPIFSGADLTGVLEIELDHSAIAASFASTFQALSIGLSLILGLAISPPLMFGWYKSIQRSRAERAARHLAFHDPLTHLPNRRYAHEEIERRLSVLADDDETMALLCLDLDGFKQVNDAFGHASGDDLLRQTSLRLTALMGSGDMLARMGGDEFLVLARLGTSVEDVRKLAAEIIEGLSAPFAIDRHDASIGVSIGMVIAGMSWRNRDELLRAGDVALYEAKSQGRGQAVLFEPSMEERLRRRREIENDLRLAISQDEFVLHYQPQFDVKTRALTGFEALVRWEHPSRGLLPPGDFIEIAEELKLISSISRWVVDRACRDAMAWRAPLKVAVNISAIEFEETDLVASIEDALAQSGLAPERLEIEITETVIMGNTEDVIDTLNAIRGLGITVAMDDFGTGYSSLGYLCKFPFDRLKIDRSFLIETDQKEQSQRIIEAIVTLGRSLELNVVAEGVEHADQLAMLDTLACNEAQGFYLGKPMAAGDANKLVDQYRIDATDGRGKVGECVEVVDHALMPIELHHGQTPLPDFDGEPAPPLTR